MEKTLKAVILRPLYLHAAFEEKKRICTMA